jgi:hypothetical protein
MQLKTEIILALVVCWFSVACAHQKAQAKPEANGLLFESSVEIVYSMGGNEHRFFAAAPAAGGAEERQPSAKTFVDKQVLKEARIQPAQYLSFLDQASKFVESPKRTPASDTNSGRCRGPFSVTVRIGKDSRSSNGCRSFDEGRLSRLVKDGEFLLYSQN